MIVMLVYVRFSFWIQICRKLYFTNLANPKNPNLNLDSMDYGCEIRLVSYEQDCGNHCKYIVNLNTFIFRLSKYIFLFYI